MESFPSFECIRIVGGTRAADDPTVGDGLDTIGAMGDGSIVSDAYTAPRVEYNLLGTTTIGGTATPNMDQFNRIQNLIWAAYGTNPSAGWRWPATSTSGT